MLWETTLAFGKVTRSRCCAPRQVSLKTHRTKAGLVKAVTKIEPLSTGTMTGLAIQFAMNVAFSESEGARVKSPDISKVTHTAPTMLFPFLI